MLIRQIKKNEILKSKQIDLVQSEFDIYFEFGFTSFYHMNRLIQVNMEGFAQDNRYVYIILEYISEGELLTYLRNAVRFESVFAAYICSYQVYLRLKSFQYFSIFTIKTSFQKFKAIKLLVAEYGYLNLTDFSFAKFVEFQTYTLCETPEYFASQIVLNTGHANSFDWWKFGILIYQINAGIEPFTDEDPMILYQNILKGKVKFPKDMDKEAEFIIKYVIIAGMLKNGVEDVKQHKWFSKIDLVQLLVNKIPKNIKPTIKYP